MKTRTRQFAPLNHTPTQSCFASLGHAHLAGQHNAVDLCDNLATPCTKYSLGAVICAGSSLRWAMATRLHLSSAEIQRYAPFLPHRRNMRRVKSSLGDGYTTASFERCDSTVQGVCAQPTPAPTRIMSCPSGYAPFLPHRRDMRRVKSSLGDGYTTASFER